MFGSEITDKLKSLIEPVLAEDNFCLVEIKRFFQGNRLTLRLLVDRMQGGITIDECARLNDKIGQLLEKEDIVQQAYVLEVSSPGLDRALVTKEDFSRCLNRKVRIFFKDSNSKQQEVEGIIIAVNDSGVNLELGKAHTQELPFEQIRKAKQIIEELR